MSYPESFITIFITAHGEDLNDDELNSDRLYELEMSGARLKQFYKLPLSGITGNITNDSDILDALYFNNARRLAHNREMNPVLKLHEIRAEVLRYRNILRETAELDMTQSDFVRKRGFISELQRVPAEPDWFPEPSRISYNRKFSFEAKPFVLADKLSGVFERTFGIWAVDASIHIALQLGLRPGTSSTNEPVSLMQLLGILPTTARTQRSKDKSGATVITLFEIMRRLLELVGHRTCINVIDMSCRYRNWGRIPSDVSLVPRSFRDEAHSPRYHETEHVDNIFDVVQSGQRIIEWVDDEIFKLDDDLFYRCAFNTSSRQLEATPVLYSPGFQLNVGGHLFEIDLETFKLDLDTDIVTSEDGMPQSRFISQFDSIFYIQRQPFVLFVRIRIVPGQPLTTRYIRFKGMIRHDKKNKRAWILYSDMRFPFQTPYGSDVTHKRRSKWGGRKRSIKQGKKRSINQGKKRSRKYKKRALSV